jgi:hypothetical protein
VNGRRFHINQDVVAGLMFVVAGGLFLWFGRNYAIGTTLRMGPGYIPNLLGWMLVGVGALIAGRGTLVAGDRLEGWALRPLVTVCGAFLIFAWTISWLGLIVTAVLTMMCAAVGGAEFRLREQTVAALVAAAVVAIVFLYGLGLPMRYWPAGVMG